MSEIEKMKARWQEHEQHKDTILDYAISQIYTHAKLIEQLQAELESKDKEIEQLKKTLEKIKAFAQTFKVEMFMMIIVEVEQALESEVKE